MSDTLISPKADHKIRSRSEAYKRKNVSPNFRDILRKRFIERVKARRGAVFDRLRFIKSEESLKFTLTEFIERDIYDLHLNPEVKSDLDALMEVSESSSPLSELAVTEKDKWILEEYERMIEASAEQLAAAAEQVVCPCCQRGVLRADCELITCAQCPLSLPARLPLPALEKLLFEGVDCHERNCDEQPTFLVCPDNLGSNLLLLCSKCGLAHQII